MILYNNSKFRNEKFFFKWKFQNDMNHITHFSLKEIKKSGLDIKLLKFNKVKVDVRRKSEKLSVVKKCLKRQNQLKHLKLKK